VVAAVARHLALHPFFFDVAELTARGELLVAADDAAAREGSKSEESDRTHCLVPMAFWCIEQWTYRSVFRARSPAILRDTSRYGVSLDDRPLWRVAGRTAHRGAIGSHSNRWTVAPLDVFRPNPPENLQVASP